MKFFSELFELFKGKIKPKFTKKPEFENLLHFLWDLIFYYPSVISLIIIILLTILSMKMPFFSFIFALFMGIFFLLMSLPFRILENLQEKLFLKINMFLYKTGLLDLLAVINIKFFSGTNLTLFFRFFIVFGITVFHIFFSRWYFIQSVFFNRQFSGQTYLLIFFLLFIGIGMSYFRFLIIFSQFVLPLTIKKCSWLLSEPVLYIFGENPDDIPKTPSYNSDSPTEKKFSFINFNMVKNYYQKSYNNNGTSTFKYIGLGIGLLTMGAAVATAFYAKEQTEYTKQQTEYAKQQAYDTRREADAAAVDSGLITKDEYWRRHPQDALHKPQKK